MADKKYEEEGWVPEEEIIFQNAPKPTSPSIDINDVSIVSRCQEGWLVPHISHIRALILQPSTANYKLSNASMVLPNSKWNPVPLHLLDLEDTRSVCPVLAAWIVYWLNGGADEDKEAALIIPSELVFMADPSPLLSQMSKVRYLRPTPNRFKIKSSANCLLVLETKLDYSQVEVMVWTEHVVRSRERWTRMVVTPGSVTNSPPATRPFRILVWNARGICRPEFKSHLLALYEDHKPDLIVLTETRMGMSTLNNIEPLIHQMNSFASVPPLGLSGGILVLWSPGKVNFSQKWKPNVSGQAAIHGFVKLRDYGRKGWGQTSHVDVSKLHW